MAVAVIMPKQGQSVESCIITEWFKKKGDAVKVGEKLFSYETDKASFEEEAKADGILLEVFFQSGDDVEVLLNVAVIGNAGESTDAFRPGTPAAAPASDKKAEVKTEAKSATVFSISSVTKVDAKAPDTVSGDLKISPRAKNSAEKLGVPISNLQGSGPGGRVIEQDVKAYASSGAGLMSPTAQAAATDKGLRAPLRGTGVANRVKLEDMATAGTAGIEYEVKKISNIRRIISENMLNSMACSAQLTHHISADARAMQALRAMIKPDAEKAKMPNITINDMVCFAVIKTLLKHPNVNSHFLGDSVRLFNKVHLGIAVDTERGLMVPALRNASDFSLAVLATNLKDLAKRCRDGKIEPELLASQAGTFTVSNLGAYGIEMFTPVLNVPQVAILGVNTISYKAIDMGAGIIGFVPHIGLSLTYDHCAIDGAPASAFLKDLKTEIENLSEAIL